MLLNGNEIKIKPVLALDFPELRALFSAYYTSSLGADKEESSAALRDLLALSLKRSDPAIDPSLLLDPSNPNALDIDEIDEIVFAAGGNRGKVLRLLRDEMVNFMRMEMTSVVSGSNSSSPSPPESELPSGT